jgi:hypothetical protein
LQVTGATCPIWESRRRRLKRLPFHASTSKLCRLNDFDKQQKQRHKDRNVVERCFGRLKQWRGLRMIGLITGESRGRSVCGGRAPARVAYSVTRRDLPDLCGEEVRSLVGRQVTAGEGHHFRLRYALAGRWDLPVLIRVFTAAADVEGDGAVEHPAASAGAACPATDANESRRTVRR